MSDLNSWEDDPAAQDANLAQQTQQLNLRASQGQQQQQQGGFRPAAASFTPGAAPFQPSQPYGSNFVPQAHHQGYHPYGGQHDQFGYGNAYGQGAYNYGART